MNALLAQIPGIGEKTAKRYIHLVDSVNTLDELRRALLALPPDKFARLPVAAQADLKYEPLHKIPRALIDIINEEFHKYAPRRKFDIGGSYRRGKPTSGDLDVVLTGKWNTFRDAVNKSKRVHIHEPFAGHEYKLTTIIQVDTTNIKADIFLTTSSEYIFALLFVTGSGAFNIRMRRLAKLKGLLLNQHGLYKRVDDKSGVIEQIPIKSEKELFKLLKMTYCSPSERT